MKTTSYSATTTGKSFTLAERHQNAFVFVLLFNLNGITQEQNKIAVTSTTFEASLLVRDIISGLFTNKKKVRRKIASSYFICAIHTVGSRVGAVVRALASHQCVPGSISGPGVICGLSLLLVLYSAPRGFSPGTPVFPSHQKPTLLNSNSIWKQWMKSHLVEMPLQIPLLLLLLLVLTNANLTN